MVEGNQLPMRGMKVENYTGSLKMKNEKELRKLSISLHKGFYSM